MYLYTKVTDLLDSLNATKVHHNQRKYYIETNYPDLYSSIISQTSFLSKPSLVERLYCYTNNIAIQPTCKVCSNSVSFSRHRHYHTYCSQRCSMLDMKTLLGVENPSQLQSVKDKKKITRSNWTEEQINKIGRKISQKKTEFWNDVYKDVALPMSIKEYQKSVWRYTNKSYREEKQLLDPNNIRSTDWHVDHKFSISEGYRNNVAPEIIGHIANLRMLDRHTNCAIKGSKCSITLNELLTAFTSHTYSL